MPTCEEQLAQLQADVSAYLAAWDTFRTQSDQERTEDGMEVIHQAFYEAGKEFAVKQGHPGQPYPRRRP